MAWKNQYNSFFGETASILCCFLCAQRRRPAFHVCLFTSISLRTANGRRRKLYHHFVRFLFRLRRCRRNSERDTNNGQNGKVVSEESTRETRAQWLTQWLGVCECMLTNDIKLLARTFFVYFPARTKTTIVRRVPLVSAASSVTTEKENRRKVLVVRDM